MKSVPCIGGLWLPRSHNRRRRAPRGAYEQSSVPVRRRSSSRRAANPSQQSASGFYHCVATHAPCHGAARIKSPRTRRYPPRTSTTHPSRGRTPLAQCSGGSHISSWPRPWSMVHDRSSDGLRGASTHGLQPRATAARLPSVRMCGTGRSHRARHRGGS